MGQVNFALSALFLVILMAKGVSTGRVRKFRLKLKKLEKAKPWLRRARLQRQNMEKTRSRERALAEAVAEARTKRKAALVELVRRFRSEEKQKRDWAVVEEKKKWGKEVELLKWQKNRFWREKRLYDDFFNLSQGLQA